jgi:hypothetical protein
MDLSTLWTFLGGGATFAAIAALIAKLLSDRHIERVRADNNMALEQLKHSHTLEMEKLKGEVTVELERQRAAINRQSEATKRYSETQFASYVSLWTQLQDLRVTADNLWEKATPQTLESFVQELVKTRRTLEVAGVILEPDLYHSLQRNVEVFDRFYRGKKRLIEIRSQAGILEIKQTLNADEGHYDVHTALHQRRYDTQRMLQEVREQISNNQTIMQDYRNTLEQIREDMQRKLSGTQTRSKNHEH